MKKVIFILVIAASISLYAQNKNQQKQNSNVELPEFVITGKDIVTLRKAKKIPPNFISTLSPAFIKPAFPTENLPVKELATPVKGTIGLLDSLNFVRGHADFDVGSYDLPNADLYYSAPFPVGLFSAYANAYNRRPYISNTEKYHINGGANLLLSVKDNAGFLPGTQIKFHGDLGTTSYKLFGSNTPNFKRVFNAGDAFVKVDNLMSKYFLFSAKFADGYYSLGNNENFSENMFKVSGLARFTLPNFNLGGDVIYKRQILTNNALNQYPTSFIAVKPTMGLSINKLMKVSFGFNYDNYKKSFLPYAAIALDFGNGISVYGDIDPHTEFWGGGYFLKQNPYFMAQKFTNIFLRKKIAFNSAIKFEYFTYFEIDAGFKYYSSDNLPYFTDKNSIGKFDLVTTSANNYTAFVNLLFHPGPAGVFYSTAQLSDTKNTSGNFIPYYPLLKATLNYNYNFDIGLNAGASITYLSDIYTDIQNNNKLTYVNLGINLEYKLRPGFYLTLKLNNLLNRHNNYLWNNYQEMPLDVMAGLNYRW